MAELEASRSDLDSEQVVRIYQSVPVDKQRQQSQDESVGRTTNPYCEIQTDKQDVTLTLLSCRIACRILVQRLWKSVGFCGMDFY
jgi:hypothetical protein